MIPRSTRLYHLTHIANLATIVAKGGLGSPNELRSRRIGYTSIAHREIQGRRVSKAIPCGPGGVVHDYVPYFFAPRPPMLLALQKGNVLEFGGSQADIVYLVTTVETVLADGRAYVFTDGHAVMAVTEFFDDVAQLDRVDWQVMRSRHWAATPDDPDRQRRRQAEFLVHGSCPWRLIQELGVANQQMRERVVQEIAMAGHKPEVVVHPEWYY